LKLAIFLCNEECHTLEQLLTKLPLMAPRGTPSISKRLRRTEPFKTKIKRANSINTILCALKGPIEALIGKVGFFFLIFGLAKTLSYRPVPFERDADGTPQTYFL
jgi:hypothetical protein